MREYRKLWIGLIILILLTPIGLILPEMFHAGSAWGEWSGDEIKGLVGYVPKGISRLGDIWKAPMPDYAVKGQENAPVHKLSLSYILSALIGIAVIVGITLLIGKVLTQRDRSKTT